jgi:hypothetical protein
VPRPDALELQAHAITTAMKQKHGVMIEDYWRRNGRAFLKYWPPGGPMQVVTVTPFEREPGPTDPLAVALDAIADRIANGSRLKVAEEDAPRLLTALRFLLDALPCATAEERTALTALLTGQEAPSG